MKLFTKRFFFIVMAVCFFAATLAAQQVDQYIEQVQSGEYAKAKAQLPRLQQEYPNDPGVLYLQGLLETDGERAHQYFKEVADYSGWSQYKDDAIMKVAEYLYARGLYNGAGTYLKKIPVQYSRSPHLSRASAMLLNSLMEAGKADSARAWQEMLTRQFPDLRSGDQLAVARKSDSGSIARDSVAAPRPVDLSKANPYTEGGEGSESDGSSVREVEKSGVQGKYAIQVGAFSTLANAMEQKKKFESMGHGVEIRQRKRGNLELYLVWLGSFQTRGEAERVGRAVKSRLDTPFFIVESD